MKTTRALDGEFPSGLLDAGLFAALVAAKRVDVTVAGLLNKLRGFTNLTWAPHLPAFARAQILAGNLAGIVRASQAADLKPRIAATHHPLLDAAAAALAGSSSTGPYATTTRFEDPDATRVFVLVQDAFLDRAGLGGDRHGGALLMLAHELTHVRNRVLERSLKAGPIGSADYVDVAKANGFSTLPGNFSTAVTRGAFVAELGCRQGAWRVYQELVGDHAGAMLAAGTIVRPAAVGELQAAPQPKQLFRSAIAFAAAGVEPNQTYSDNGYMADLSDGPAATFNHQVAMWMANADRLRYHDDQARSDEVSNALTAEAAAQGPAFATPTVDPAGLISA